MKLHDKQREVVKSPKRFKIVRAGRKGGKSAGEVETICFKATASVSKLGYLSKKVFPTGRKVLYLAPTQPQARSIVWSALKTRLHGVGIANEQMLQMRVPNEDGEITTIYVGGWENRENYRGLSDVIHITFDEVDTLRDFFSSWMDIFRPMFLDTRGTANFIGTPNKTRPNLKRLEKEAVGKEDWGAFKFTSKDNPHLPIEELIALEEEYKNDYNSYKQEILAEYVENEGSLFKYEALVDVFSNTIVKKPEKYLIIDVADDGTDSTVFSYWEGLEEYNREEYSHMSTESIINKIRESAAKDRIPYSHVAVDAIGVGAAVASSSLLDGIVGYKSSFAPIKTDINIVRLPNVGYLQETNFVSDFKNLRCQCVVTLAHHVNEHKIASKVQDRFKETVIEELSIYQDASSEDGKRSVTSKEEVKASLGRSPDHSDTWIMRMYFEIKNKMSPHQSEDRHRALQKQDQLFRRNVQSQSQNSAR